MYIAISKELGNDKRNDFTAIRQLSFWTGTPPFNTNLIIGAATIPRGLGTASTLIPRKIEKLHPIVREGSVILPMLHIYALGFVLPNELGLFWLLEHDVLTLFTETDTFLSYQYPINRCKRVNRGMDVSSTGLPYISSSDPAPNLTPSFLTEENAVS